MREATAIDKLPTHIPGLDYVCDGGLPCGRITLVSGTAGSSKTVMASQFLIGGIREDGEPGVFVTCEEFPDDLRRNMLGFGWDVAELERIGQWAFVDASPEPLEITGESGDYDLDAFVVRIEAAIRRTGARRVSIDSIGSIFSRFGSAAIVRRELFRLCARLKEFGVTTVLTAERIEESGEIARYGVEEFVADNVILLRNSLEGDRRRRTIEVLKFRGTGHRKGEYPFSVMPEQGMVVIPLSAVGLEQHSSSVRITSGNQVLDTMCGGGFFRDSIVLVSGATGTGKTLMATEFVAGGVKAGERCLFLAFEESREQLFRNAASWGIDLAAMEQGGLLKVLSAYPESDGLEDHLIHVKQHLKDFEPTRLAVDSLSALERIASPKAFREFVIGLTSHVKHGQIAGLFTATTPNLLGGMSVTDVHISTITDSIILLRYVEIYGEMRRGLTVLKMRGSRHDRDIREFGIDHDGLHIGPPLREVAGILTTTPRHASTVELDQIRDLFSGG